MKAFLKLILYQPLYNALILLALIVPGHSMGWAIIILTLLIRFVLLIPSAKAIHQQKKIKELQPKLNELKELYKGDQKKLTQETMALYKRYGVNPFGSCLPLLIQLPILIILYQVFMRGLTVDSFHNLYGWVSRPESLNNSFFGIDLTKPDLWILPIITGALQFVQGWQIQPKGAVKSDDTTAMITKQMMYVFPVMTVLIARSLPAALPIYWATTNLFSIIQQALIFKDKHKEIEVREIKADNNQSSTANQNPPTATEEVIKGEKGSTITIRKKN